MCPLFILHSLKLLFPGLWVILTCGFHFVVTNFPAASGVSVCMWGSLSWRHVHLAYITATLQRLIKDQTSCCLRHEKGELDLLVVLKLEQRVNFLA